MREVLIRPGGGTAAQVKSEAQLREQPHLPAYVKSQPVDGIGRNHGIEQHQSSSKDALMWFALGKRSVHHDSEGIEADKSFSDLHQCTGTGLYGFGSETSQMLRETGSPHHMQRVAWLQVCPHFARYTTTNQACMTSMGTGKNIKHHGMLAVYMHTKHYCFVSPLQSFLRKLQAEFAIMFAAFCPVFAHFDEQEEVNPALQQVFQFTAR